MLFVIRSVILHCCVWSHLVFVLFVSLSRSGECQRHEDTERSERMSVMMVMCYDGDDVIMVVM